MPDEEAVFKLITKDNWELISEFLDFNRGAIRRHIGYYVWWNGLPGESTWSFYPRVPELHVNVRRYHGSRSNQSYFERTVLYLSQIDREIANRKALEQSHVSQARRELAAFDIVFAELENKEKK